MRRFTRLTNAHSKKIENQGHAFAIYSVYYNFARIHQTLRVTPAIVYSLSRSISSPIPGSAGKYAARICTRRHRSTQGASSLWTQRAFSRHCFKRSFPTHNVMTVTSRASCSEIMTRHPANPDTPRRAPASACGIADCTRCVSWGFATNSTLRAVTPGEPAVDAGAFFFASNARGKRSAAFLETLV
jgi:hypothetical protein